MNEPFRSPAASERKRATRHQRLIWMVPVATGCRLLLNTARRFAYPFAPALSRGLHVPLTSITSIIALTQITAFIGILGGPLADKWGYRRTMISGLGLLVIGMAAAAAGSVYMVVTLGLLSAGLGKSLFDPAVYGYTGQQVPFNKRGRVIGIMEFSWAGSALAGIPLIGFLINSQGWQAPFWFMGGLGVAGILFILRIIPRDSSVTVSSSRQAASPAWRRLIRERPALGLLGFAFCMSLGNDQLFVVYGAWMENSFNISVAALGLSTGVIGLAELCGELLIAVFSDRIGLKRTIFLGTLLTIVGYLLLPVLGVSLKSTLTGLFLLFLAFEFSMVCGISLGTEALPSYRATMMAAFYAAAGLGRVVGALIGGPVWLIGGIAAVCVASAAATGVSLVCLYWGAVRYLGER